nr:MAG: class I SAM-dependent methyltransferase [Leptolyngbya sp. IPPAS B-1204]
MLMSIKIARDDNRTLEQIKQHYELEKGLAHQLKTADKQERKYLYTALYDQLFEQIPHHPQLARKADVAESQQEVSRKLKLLARYLVPELVFLEIGPGDCCLSLEVARQVKKVYAIDVSNEITKNLNCPDNFDLIIFDGYTIPLPANIIDLAYSNQLMEHLHPDDAVDQLYEVYRLLKSGGVYICITPNRLSGPHDVSKYFDETASGFHLKEYTCTELADLFSVVGFSKITSYIGGKGLYMKFPLALIQWVERFLSSLSFSVRSKIARTMFFRALLGVILVAEK